MDHTKAMETLKAADPKRNYSAGRFGAKEYVVAFWPGIKTRATQEFRGETYLAAVNLALDALGKPKIEEPTPPPEKPTE